MTVAEERAQAPAMKSRDFQCPFCPEPAPVFLTFGTYRQHCLAKHKKLECPACGGSYSNLALHMWGRTVYAKVPDPRHELALVSLFNTVGKSRKIRERMHALERKVLADWPWYAAGFRRPR